MNVDHKPRDEFERKAVEALRAGQEGFELVREQSLPPGRSDPSSKCLPQVSCVQTDIARRSCCSARDFNAPLEVIGRGPSSDFKATGEPVSISVSSCCNLQV